MALFLTRRKGTYVPGEVQIELPFRSDEASAKVELHLRDGSCKTLAQWSHEYLASLNDEPELTTEYAEAYREGIFDSQNRVLEGVTPYDLCVREDMAEAFVASHFDIISNPHGYTSFKSHPFGNANSANMLRDHAVASRKATLMNALRTSRIRTVGQKFPLPNPLPFCPTAGVRPEKIRTDGEIMI